MEFSLGKIVTFCIIFGIIIKVYLFYPYQFINYDVFIDKGNTENQVRIKNRQSYFK